MEARQMTPFFSSTFSVFVAFIFVFENGQNSFSCGPPFGPFWSAKYLNFRQKLPIRTARHTFVKSRNPEVTKNQYYVFSWGESKKWYQIMDYRALSIEILKNHCINIVWICKSRVTNQFKHPNSLWDVLIHLLNVSKKRTHLFCFNFFVRFGYQAGHT